MTNEMIYRTLFILAFLFMTGIRVVSVSVNGVKVPVHSKE